jgi:hypothetical protein
VETNTPKSELEIKFEDWQRTDKQLLELASDTPTAQEQQISEVKDRENSILTRKLGFIRTFLQIGNDYKNGDYFPNIDVVKRAKEVMTDEKVGKKYQEITDGVAEELEIASTYVDGLIERRVPEIRRLALAADIEEQKGNTSLALQIQLLRAGLKYGNKEDVTRMATDVITRLSKSLQ